VLSNFDAVLRRSAPSKPLDRVHGSWRQRLLPVTPSFITHTHTNFHTDHRYA